MSENVFVIHVLNKPSVGGAERLVESIIKSNSSANIMHLNVFIAKNKFEIFLFGKRLFRLIPIIIILIKLQFLIFKFEVNRRKSCLVFHLAEAHVINKYIFVKSKSKYVRIIHYVHQSKDLYPSKLHSSAYSSAQKSDLVVTYSTLVLESWNFKQPKFISLPNPVSNEVLKYQHESHKNVNNTNNLNFIYLGRLAKWKRPDKCVEFVSYFGKKYDTSLKFIGFEKLEFEKLYGKSFLNEYKNLNVKFLGIKLDVKSEIITSDINLYFADSNHSYESIGISAEECLVLGVPTVIIDKKFTQFKDSPGIFELKDFIENGELKESVVDLISNIDTNRKNVSRFWKDLASIENYLTVFHEQLIKLYS